MADTLPKHVRLIEVGPRDGLQNEPSPVPLEAKLQLLSDLAEAGLDYLEAGSFVHPARVPQMADSDALFQQMSRHPEITYAALTPNLKGLERALAVKADEVALFAAASETFSQKNINCSIAESLERFKPVINTARQAGIPVRGYISCVLGCPYEGSVPTGAVRQLTGELLHLGCREVSLGDTIGVGTAGETERLLDQLVPEFGAQVLAVHFHDTYGQALTNILVALRYGINRIDSAVAGLGGCPFAPGAAGNVATEDVVYLLNGLGIEHGVDLNRLVAAGDRICQTLQRPNASRVARALLARH